MEKHSNDSSPESPELHSEALPRQVEAVIAGAYLSGTNTRRVRRALGALFKGAVGKDVVSRTWRKVQTDWEAWCRRSLAEEDVVRLVLDGTVVRVRLDRKATFCPSGEVHPSKRGSSTVWRPDTAPITILQLVGRQAEEYPRP